MLIKFQNFLKTGCGFFFSRTFTAFLKSAFCQASVFRRKLLSRKFFHKFCKIQSRKFVAVIFKNFSLFFFSVEFIHKVRDAIFGSVEDMPSKIFVNIRTLAFCFSVRFIENEFRPCFQHGWSGFSFFKIQKSWKSVCQRDF